MTARQDLTGKTFGLLTVIEACGSTNAGKRLWRCSCSCGGETVVVGSHLSSGNTSSCGCGRQRFKPSHGGAYKPEYRVWHLMKQRCRNQNQTSYGAYGGRGITVCERWAQSFEAFLEDMGPRPSPQHQLDRIDNDRGYEPGNCRWATRLQNMRNQRKTIWATLDGDKRSLPEWCERLGLNYGTVKARVQRGISPEQALAEFQK
jgi:hypothetical protein